VGIPVGRDRLTVKPLTLPGCAPASAPERLFDGLTCGVYLRNAAQSPVRTDDSTKITPGGQFGGQNAARGR
jgi:hypothetical protein